MFNGRYRPYYEGRDQLWHPTALLDVFAQHCATVTDDAFFFVISDVMRASFPVNGTVTIHNYTLMSLR